MQNLYKDQPFYKKIELERPGFLDELIQAMIKAIDELPEDNRPSSPADLSNLKLSDPRLDRVLYKMLRGASYVNVLTDEQKIDEAQKLNPGQKSKPEVEVEAPGDEEDLSEEKEEFKSPEGYYSLLDFVAGRTKPKVRVYLAPKQVLQSIFHDPATVQSIIEERERLFKQASADIPVKTLEESFKNQFVKMKDPVIDEDILDFSITKTNPKYYR